MIKFCVLGSGSKGNSVWVQVDNTQILLDCGFTGKKTRHALATINKRPHDIDAVYITHMHNDHCASKKCFKKLGTPIYHGESVNAGDAVVECFSLDHDLDCYGYKVSDQEGNSLLYITDTGSIPCDSLKTMIDCNAIIVEMNHDIETMLDDVCVYPDDLKIRVFDTHLSNEKAADLLSLLDWPGLKYVVPYHISKQTNSNELVKYEAGKYLGDGVEVVMTDQKEPTVMMVMI